MVNRILFLAGWGGEGGGVNKLYCGLCENDEFKVTRPSFFGGVPA